VPDLPVIVTLAVPVVALVATVKVSVFVEVAGPRGGDARSHTTRIAEVENAGSPKERVLPPMQAMGSCGA